MHVVESLINSPLDTSKFEHIITFTVLNMITQEEKLVIDLQTRVFKTLTHPARLAILEILRGGEQCVCHMEAHLGYRQAYISQQLSVLRENGLIQDRRDGWNIFYSVTKKQIFDVLDAMYQMTNAQRPELNHPKSPCCCPKCSD